MFENKLVAICIIDIETLAFLDVNDTHVRIYGYSREELINRITLFDLTTEPDVLRKSFQQIKTSGTAHIALRYHRKKDGTLFPVELVGSIHYLKDRPVAFVIARDITERIRAEEALRASEQRLALALKATQDALWDLDLTTNTLYCSSLWWEMIGYGENEIEFDRELWFRLMHPDDMEEARRIVRKAVAEHDSFELEARLLHKDGHYVHTLTKGFILRDKDGKAVRLSGINTDLTNRKRAEEERRQWEWQKQQLEKAESLSRMAAAIAHKFNNMLGVVIGNLDLAMAGLSPKTEPYETVAEAMKASRRAAAVSGQMLTYLGKAIVKYESLDLAQTCRSALPMLRTVLGNSILFEADIPAAGPYIKGNAIQIQEILKVLTTNASEAIGENEGIIHFALRAVPSAEIPTVNRFPINWSPQETAYACIEVGDTGGGIKDENIAQIFDPFFSTKFPGRGLGLAIALGIVRAHRGGITVKNTPGQGCVFRIFFPLSGFERKLETEIHS
jgi:PAS domain S-box-containing protein